jgi:hypothetical protein
MASITIGRAIAIVTLLIGVLVVACGAAQRAPEARPGQLPAPSGDETQVIDGGSVTVAVTWKRGAGGAVFTVVLDTHAVDLDAFDLTKLAVLRTNEGREVAPSAWSAPLGGHHRQGDLTFPISAIDGTPIISPTTRTIELVVRDVAGVPERRFRWAL